MKIDTISQKPLFKPVTITLESIEELEIMLAILYKVGGKYKDIYPGNWQSNILNEIEFHTNHHKVITRGDIFIG